ncbi:MAG: hypothetical protein ACRDZ1_02950 [Acidimicrobiia bacterium]
MRLVVDGDGVLEARSRRLGRLGQRYLVDRVARGRGRPVGDGGADRGEQDSGGAERGGDEQ